MVTDYGLMMERQAHNQKSIASETYLFIYLRNWLK